MCLNGKAQEPLPPLAKKLPFECSLHGSLWCVCYVIACASHWQLVVCVDMDDAKGCSPVRYTRKQRARDKCIAKYAIQQRREKPDDVKAAETSLAGFHSRSSTLDDFKAYCERRHETLDACLDFYGQLPHRQRRWKTSIKTQQSEERLYQRLEAIHEKGDDRPMVLAYGSWGLIAGSPVNRGIPP